MRCTWCFNLALCYTLDYHLQKAVSICHNKIRTWKNAIFLSNFTLINNVFILSKTASNEILTADSISSVLSKVLRPGDRNLNLICFRSTRNKMRKKKHSPPSSVITSTVVAGPGPSGLNTCNDTRYWVYVSKRWISWLCKLLWNKKKPLSKH